MYDVLLEFRTLLSWITVIAILIAYKKIKFSGILLNAIAETEVLVTRILIKSGFLVHDELLYGILSTTGTLIKTVGYLLILLAFIELRDPNCWVLECLRKLKKLLTDSLVNKTYWEVLYDQSLR